jgi:hypothetical protein
MSTFPTSYIPNRVPTLPDGLSVFLTKEFRNIQDTLNGIRIMLPQEAAAAPSILKPGMIRFAKSPWHPASGQTSDAWVSYDAGVWTLI